MTDRPLPAEARIVVVRGDIDQARRDGRRLAPDIARTALPAEAQPKPFLDPDGAPRRGP